MTRFLQDIVRQPEELLRVIDYLNGKLQYLFIAPERLRVAGFPEMLARRKPSLIAIDEAHCIRNGDMIFGRITVCSANICRCCDRHR